MTDAQRSTLEQIASWGAEGVLAKRLLRVHGCGVMQRQGWIEVHWDVGGGCWRYTALRAGVAALERSLGASAAVAARTARAKAAEAAGLREVGFLGGEGPR